ncbi:MAG: HAD family hydrolase [Vicinamibacterales bacterium]
MPAPRPLPAPRAILFDLFHTLVSLPPLQAGEPAIADILGVPHEEWERCFYRDDVLGRALGHATDALDIMRVVTHGIDPSVGHDRIVAAVETRRRRIEDALLRPDPAFIEALDLVRAAGIRTALVSDAGADDVECWQASPLRERLDAVCFSFALGVRKPDPRIYQHAMAAVGAVPAETLFVGDGGSDELQGARALGIGTVLVTRLVGMAWPHVLPDRRPHADWEFEDVPAFVGALMAYGSDFR